MLTFKTEQRVVEISPELKLGGQPGEFPTVLIGSIFHKGHKIIKDHITGAFDKCEAEILINRTVELSEFTGNPQILDIIGSTSKNLIERIEFVADICEAPFLVDGPAASVRIPVIQHLYEIGLSERAIYNSISEDTGCEEIQALKEYKVKSAILLAFNPGKIWPEDRLLILKGDENNVGLLNLADEAGIDNKLIDTAVLDFPSIGLAAKSINICKEEFGLPCGCGPSNATYTWRRRRDFSRNVSATCDSVTDVVTQLQGADFILYGSIGEAERVFPSCAIIDALIAYVNKRYGIKPKTKNHPIKKIM